MATTKEKIIETSIELFNEKGCLNTSTRHIADKLGISVGNLYYHFKNKEKILIDIFLNYIKIVFKEVNSINYEKDEIFLLKDFLLNNLETDIKYRFLHLELNILLLSFPEFKKIMEEQLQNEIKMIKKLLNHQISYGYIKAMSENEMNFLVSNSWIIATNNLSYWNLLSKDLIANAKRGSLNMYYFIKPYLTQKSLGNERVKDIEDLLLKDYYEL
ncbi:TetR/AcrR family transcriptional regulator [Poseidonibacter ostreae]|jgi:AcrR family transcriptional regulator|uniref:TetR family transcriptional regulator n=1 Tax=Poseidonibacter ostreae TaxID=2654171 RepID=A0A6L4WQF4_9BACT|nr:TetR/AcrR family transcriptional regulator [Poseidonibacter ostreae]KAB7885859.1 TetR family transcriptional regulator [Poseidonibacter ostreae]KAB7886998.1 TetR family transcriptional regulator [Poseidonibacter ostreae]KAB7889329.1 TetR family transcriptional regulator [Poseidonibacter ostreae]